jgi:6-phosphogluconate dehydrogenase
MMKLGYIGLGKMGYNMVELLLDKGHQVVVYNRSPDPVKKIAQRGAEPADSIRSLVKALTPPRLVWLMVPYQSVDIVLKDLVALLTTGDVVIDGGNSPYKETMRRSAELGKKGIDFLDAGTSGGPAGARTGACIMVGGKKGVFEQYEELFRDLSAEKGYGYFGSSGAGHFVKMVHNGIEYGMMQALAEGFAVMKESPFHMDMVKIADLYNHRSVIESRLVGWLKTAFEQYGAELKDISGSVAQSGEAMWTVDAAKELGIPVPIIQAALDFRIQSEKKPNYIGKIVSALRHQFGGHEVTAKPIEGAVAAEGEKKKRKIA